MRKLLEELFSRYYGEIYRYLYSLSHDASLSEDLASETFLEAVKSIALFRGEADIRTWLFAIARRRWLVHLRRLKKRPQAGELTETLPDPSKLPEELLLDREAAERISCLLAEEPERTRIIMTMLMEGYSFREIGLKTGISENSARVIHFRVREKLGKILRQEGYIDA